MPTGHRRALGIASGPTVGPRLVPPGGAFTSGDQSTPMRLEFVPIELIAASADSTVAAGGGNMTALFQVPGDRVWKIERIAVSTTSTQPTAASVYVGNNDPDNLVDYTPSGNADVADETNPIVLGSGQVLRVRWTGASVGAVGTARIQGWAGALERVPVH